MDQGQTQPLNNTSFPPEKTSSQKEINLLLGVESLTITNPPCVSELRKDIILSEPEKPTNPPVQANGKCQYCGESFSQELINQHQEDCDMRKIFCEGCSTFIPIEIFDYHTNVCVYQGDVVDNHEGEYNEEDWQEEGYDEHYGEEDDDYDELDGNYTGLHTYEQLSALDNNIVKQGISEEEMKNFPLEEYKEEGECKVRCSVCITEYEDGETLRKLKCGHKFHKDCVDTWLAHNITCPVCKTFLR